jgi:hypothetical protein
MTRFVSLIVACFVMVAIAVPVLNQAAQIVA